jgi:hypothetical protein
MALLSCYSFLFLMLLAGCSSTRYYVSAEGDDNNRGTKSHPFKSIAAIQKLQLKPGDEILLRGGETFEGTLKLEGFGEREDSIKLTSYGVGIATIDGKHREALIIKGNYISVIGIRTIGSGRNSGNATNGILLIDASNACIKNITTEGFQKSGIELQNCRNVLIENVRASQNGFCGLHVTARQRLKSRNIIIRNCTAENNAGDPTNLTNHSGNGILVGMSDSVLIDHCVATGNGWDMPRVGNGPVGIWAYESNRVVIQYCISYRNRTSNGGKDGGGFDFDGGMTNSIIQYCLSYENEGAGYGLFQYEGASPWYNNVLRYCVSVGDATSTEGSGGIFCWNGSLDSTQLRNCYIHNNLVHSKNAPAVQFEPASLLNNFIFTNNIFIGTDEIVHGPSSGEKFAGNVWWHAQKNSRISFRGFSSLNEWAASSGQETARGEVVGKQMDPLLFGTNAYFITDPYKLQSVMGFKLQSTSPLINSGMPLQMFFDVPLPRTDFYGTPLPQHNPEPGVWEFSEDTSAQIK